MKTLVPFFSLLGILLFSFQAKASTRSVENINSALNIIDIEMQAIYSGNYTHYRPETIRNILRNLYSLSESAAQSADTRDAREALQSLMRSLDEEYSYSFRFQKYRLESTRLLLTNYQRLLQIARRAEQGKSDVRENCPGRMYCGG
ncbi:MAG: hypothetical protein M9962_07235 [Oligoflexia bacterium]|nr:hypothetical protein [Oligoflexia bacterium]